MSTLPTEIDLCALGVPPGMPALTISRGQAYIEAASVCFDEVKHVPGAKLEVRGHTTHAFDLLWPACSDQMRRTNNDLQDATRDGAVAVALKLALVLTGNVAVQQSRKGTGFDYWIGPDADIAFTQQSRLEISGILRGTDDLIRQRLRQKQRQTTRSDDTALTAYACVVEFSRPEAHFVQR